MKINCSIIYDLLPLYIDGVCSEESRALIEEHLAECPQCSKKHASMTRNLTIDEFTDHEEKELMNDNKDEQQKERDDAAKKVLKRIKRRWLLSAIPLLLLIPLILLGINQYRGEGISYTNLYDHYSAGRFLTALEKGDYEKAFSYIDINFYYNDIQERMINSKTATINKEDYTLMISEDGSQSYSNGEIQIPVEDEEDFEQWIREAEQGLKETKEWYEQSEYNDMTYEEFYEISKANFLNHINDWDELEYTIQGHKRRYTTSGAEGTTQLKYYIYISDGKQTTKTGGISLHGNNKGKFYLGGGFYKAAGDPMEELGEALSIWEY